MAGLLSRTPTSCLLAERRGCPQQVRARRWRDWCTNRRIWRLLVDPLPAVRGEPFLRQEAALVVHLARAFDPIAEIDVRQSHAPRARDVVENHEGAERTRRLIRLEERIDHR